MTETTEDAALSELLTPRHLAARWNCSVGHLANLRSSGLGPAYVKIGMSVRYRVSDLVGYEQARRVDPGSLSTGLSTGRPPASPLG